jgi:carbonic anhydrase
MKVYADNDGNIDRDNIGYKNFYYYKGSNTSPPCYEDVHHYIMMSPLVIPKSELDKLQQKSYD